MMPVPSSLSPSLSLTLLSGLFSSWIHWSKLPFQKEKSKPAGWETLSLP